MKKLIYGLWSAKHISTPSTFTAKKGTKIYETLEAAFERSCFRSVHPAVYKKEIEEEELVRAARSRRSYDRRIVLGRALTGWELVTSEEYMELVDTFLALAVEEKLREEVSTRNNVKELKSLVPKRNFQILIAQQQSFH
jgi:hypothetical protein